MSEYRRFVAYIYEYPGGRKGSNCGYVKTEIRNGVCRLRLHVQPVKGIQGEIKVYGFVRREDKIVGIPLGNTVQKNNALDFQFASGAVRFANSPYDARDIRGIWLRGGDKENYITVWDDEPVAPDRFVEGHESPALAADSSPAEEKIEELPAAEDEKPAAESAGASASAEQRNAVQPMTFSGSFAARWPKFLYHYPHIQPFDDGEITQCIQIAPKDINFLPREEWVFGKNTFLHQAYMQHRHLMLGCHRDGYFVLGVPGVCRDLQDRHLARMYGFPCFKEAADMEEKKQPGGTFGYWYHFIEKN
ncbi:MAG: hypothetical protein Q4C50_09445 [Eubacteriales bacterium]|nr:hypothetical protein [Eubacteriales bacterium]